MTSERGDGPRRGSALLRNLVRFAAAGAIALGSLFLLDWVHVASEAMPQTRGIVVYFAVLGLALLIYALLLALPYVPGVEVGIMILAMQGPGAALPVYLATLAGLALAFAAGSRLPPGWLAGMLRDLRLERAAGLIERVTPLSGEARLELLRARLPDRLAILTRGWRYVVLALVLNLPGNWLIGGGGGIMLLAGLSGLFSPSRTLATVALAVAPVPLLVWGFGIELI